MSSQTTDRLNEISNELSSILEARIQELMEAMRKAEQATRRIVSTEMEIGRYTQLQESLGGEISGLTGELGSLRTRAEEVRSQHAGLTEERDRVRELVSRQERDVREADAQIEEGRARLKSLEEEAEVLRRENADLKAKIRTLEENVGRMRKLKEELMMSISGLTAQMTALNIGSKE